MNLKPEDYDALAHEVAGLPSEIESEAEEAKRFDLLMLRLQLSRLRHSGDFNRLSEQLKEIAALLEEKSSIPMINDQMALILEIQSDEWWPDLTLQMLEIVRKRLRLLVKFIEKAQRKIIYTDFEDQIGDGEEIELPVWQAAASGGFGEAGNLENFRLKARAFLKLHHDHVTIRKLRMNQTLTKSDLRELERMLAENAIGDKETIERATAESQGLGVFIRSLVGLDREVAKQALAGFLQGKTLAANQIEFVNLIIDHLTEHGVMDEALLYESPFTDINPRGPEGVFASEELGQLFAVIRKVRETALVA